MTRRSERLHSRAALKQACLLYHNQVLTKASTVSSSSSSLRIFALKSESLSCNYYTLKKKSNALLHFAVIMEMPFIYAKEINTSFISRAAPAIIRSCICDVGIYIYLIMFDLASHDGNLHIRCVTAGRTMTASVQDGGAKMIPSASDERSAPTNLSNETFSLQVDPNNKVGGGRGGGGE